MIWSKALQVLSKAIKRRATDLVKWFIQPGKKDTSLSIKPEYRVALNQHVYKHLLEIQKVQSRFSEKGYKINIE